MRRIRIGLNYLSANRQVDRREKSPYEPYDDGAVSEFLSR
jgi:hypothetical protein